MNTLTKMCGINYLNILCLLSLNLPSTHAPLRSRSANSYPYYKRLYHCARLYFTNNLVNKFN